MENYTLSKRENQVATLVATGDTTKEICEKLHVSPHTVNKTRANIYEKRGVRNVGELSTWWFCFKFNISHADVELKRAVSIMSCLVLLIVASFANIDDIARGARRSRRSRREPEIIGLYEA